MVSFHENWHLGGLEDVSTHVDCNKEKIRITLVVHGVTHPSFNSKHQKEESIYQVSGDVYTHPSLRINPTQPQLKPWTYSNPGGGRHIPRNLV